MDNFESFIIGLFIGVCVVGIPIFVVSTDSVLIDGNGIASDLSRPQMQDIANYIEENYPCNFNYDSSFADPICHNGCPCPQRSDP